MYHFSKRKGLGLKVTKGIGELMEVRVILVRLVYTATFRSWCFLLSLVWQSQTPSAGKVRSCFQEKWGELQLFCP